MPKYPDLNKENDFQDSNNHHFIHHLLRFQKDMDSRTDQHLKYADQAFKNKRPKNTFKTAVQNIFNEEESNIEHEFTEIIEKRARSIEKQQSDQEIAELVEKLGYLDLRDFVAVNKYILDAKNHSNYVNQSKARLLSIALNLMNKDKIAQISENFSKIDSENIDPKQREDKKVEFLLENISEAKEFFYKNYYKLKEKNERESQSILNDFDKYDKMINSYYKKENLKRDVLNKNKYSNGNGLTDYMDSIINEYREQRSYRFEVEAQEIYEKIAKLRKANLRYEKGNIENEIEKLTNLIKYYAFFKKYNRIYIPTDNETERLIVILFFNF
jgi:hypothetical protein